LQLKELGLESGSEDEDDDEDDESGDEGDDEAVSDEREKEDLPTTNVKTVSDGENTSKDRETNVVNEESDSETETEKEKTLSGKVETFSPDEVELLRKQVEESVVFYEKSEKGETSRND